MEVCRALVFETHIVMGTSVGRRSGAIIIRRGGVALRRHGIWMRRVVGIMVHGSQGLSMCAIDGRLTLLRIDGATSTLWRHGAWLTQVRVGGMGRDEGLCLRGNGREYTFLLEALTVGATTILGRIKAGTTNLAGVSACGLAPPLLSTILPCDAGNTGMRWPFAAWELADSGRSYAAAAEDDAHIEHTCREQVGTCVAPALDEAAEAR